MPRVRTVISLLQHTHTHTLLDALYLKLHLLATHTREHHHTPSYLSEAERLQSHTMLFARNSLVYKHTGYQYKERERTAACLHRQPRCHARKVIVTRHSFRLYLNTEDRLPTTQLSSQQRTRHRMWWPHTHRRMFLRTT